MPFARRIAVGANNYLSKPVDADRLFFDVESLAVSLKMIFVTLL